MELGLCARLLGGFGILLWIGGRRKRGDVGYPDHICLFKDLHWDQACVGRFYFIFIY